MISKTNTYIQKLERLKGKREALTDQLTKAESNLVQFQKDLRFQEKAREFIKKVGLKTQQQISYNISEITTMALNSVLENPYELNIEFVERRGKTECDILFMRDEIKIDPFSGGGGAIDIASFALRIASWSMQSPKSRKVLLLDEPFKHLKGEEANRKMLEMVKQISHSLDVQILMVSDERVSRQATVESTDRLFESKIKKGVTKLNRQ
jgi:energy-coupling factor transporter ATP-binding protein EcfA2